MNWLLRRVLALGVQFRVRPENAAALLQGCSHPVCYVLERRSVTDLAVLQEACLRAEAAAARAAAWAAR